MISEQWPWNVCLTFRIRFWIFLFTVNFCYISLCLEEEVPSCIGSAAPRTAGGSCLTRSSKELPGYAKDVEHCCSFLHPDLSCSPDAVKSSKGKHAHTHTKYTRVQFQFNWADIEYVRFTDVKLCLEQRHVGFGHTWLTHGYVI